MGQTGSKQQRLATLLQDEISKVETHLVAYT
jgi:hypothetical protein